MMRVLMGNDDTGRGRVMPEHIPCLVFMMGDHERVSRHSLKRRPVVGMAIGFADEMVIVELGGNA